MKCRMQNGECKIGSRVSGHSVLLILHSAFRTRPVKAFVPRCIGVGHPNFSSAERKMHSAKTLHSILYILHLYGGPLSLGYR